jgi:predicted dithiol-disulfide oxidoreductase (DUF899 family)
MTEHPVISREQWLEHRVELLVAEKELTRRKDELATQRRALRDLFDGKSQLLVYHFMFGPDWGEGCPSCSFWADGFDGSPVHLAHRDVAFHIISNAPLPELLAYRKRMGWSFRWSSAAGTTFNADVAVADSITYNYWPVDEPIGEMPGLSAFVLDGGDIYHTYSAYSRGLDVFNPTYQMLDMAPKGRDEDGLECTMAWLRRHDAYDD